MLFGGESWALDILTFDFLVSGQVVPSAEKWAWSYLSVIEKGTPRTLELTASGVRPTGTLAAPDLAGKTVGFSYETGLIGFSPRVAACRC